MTALTGDELAGLRDYLGSAGVATAAPLHAEPLSGGRSNLTFRVSDGASTWVLRMPPRHGRTPSAHDVAREHRVVEALGATSVPVARALALCTDERVLGAPFSVSEFVTGRAMQSAHDLEALDDPALDGVVGALVETLAALHAVDHRAVGLEDFGRPDGYAARQLRRWSAQWETVGTDAAAPAAAELAAALVAALPERQHAVGIVHGDYRIDNTILAPTASQVRAVVDWELSTIGDPVADVAMMCAYRLPALDLILGEATAWTSARLPDADALAARYESAGGTPLRDWRFHLALAYFKIAVIAAGIDYRQRAGADTGARSDVGAAVAPFLEAGLRVVPRSAPVQPA